MGKYLLKNKPNKNPHLKTTFAARCSQPPTKTAHFQLPENSALHRFARVTKVTVEYTPG